MAGRYEGAREQLRASRVLQPVGARTVRPSRRAREAVLAGQGRLRRLRTRGPITGSSAVASPSPSTTHARVAAPQKLEDWGRTYWRLELSRSVDTPLHPDVACWLRCSARGPAAVTASTPRSSRSTTTRRSRSATSASRSSRTRNARVTPTTAGRSTARPATGGRPGRGGSSWSSRTPPAWSRSAKEPSSRTDGGARDPLAVDDRRRHRLGEGRHRDRPRLRDRGRRDALRGRAWPRWVSR